jgi:hypothetical protein
MIRRRATLLPGVVGLAWSSACRPARCNLGERLVAVRARGRGWYAVTVSNGTSTVDQYAEEWLHAARGT